RGNDLGRADGTVFRRGDGAKLRRPDVGRVSAQIRLGRRSRLHRLDPHGPGGLCPRLLPAASGDPATGPADQRRHRVMIGIVITTTVALMVVFALAYLVARRIDNYGIVDFVWAYSFTGVAWGYALSGSGWSSR